MYTFSPSQSTHSPPSSPYNKKESAPRTPELMRGVSAYWGLYFSYSPNKTAGEARESNLSQDLILATQELGDVADTAILNYEATSHCAAMAMRCFYALYLTRIIIFARFLDCLPRDLHVTYARTEWAVFQHDPPCTPEGNDIFATVYRCVVRTGGSIFDLKRTTEARFRALVKRNERFFPEEYGNPASKSPFYLVVDEVEAPVFHSPSSGRRPACSRRGVSALFYGFDESP